MRRTKRLIATASLALIGLGPASAACWSDQAIEAAYVRDFDAMLMVATLRCRGQGIDMTASYNKFAREKRTVLLSADEALRAHFAARPAGAHGAMDLFATPLAQRNGTALAPTNCDQYQALIDAAVAAPSDLAALVALARQAGSSPALPNGSCAAQVVLAQH